MNVTPYSFRTPNTHVDHSNNTDNSQLLSSVSIMLDIINNSFKGLLF